MRTKPKTQKQVSGEKPQLFAIAGHEWLPSNWRKYVDPNLIVRESDKAVLVRIEWKNNTPASNETPSFDVEQDAKGNLEILIYRAKHGDVEAARRLAETLRFACSQFSQLCRKHPEMFRNVARRSWQWPVLMSPHPFLCDDYEKMFSELQIGDDTPLELHKSARWKNDNAANIAFGLLGYLWFARNERRSSHIDWGKFGRSIDKLPQFTSDGAEEWWDIAKAAFLYSYPSPQDVPEISTLVKAKSKRRSPGRIKQAILEMIHDRFVSFAPPPKAYRT